MIYDCDKYLVELLNIHIKISVILSCQLDNGTGGGRTKHMTDIINYLLVYRYRGTLKEIKL